MEEVKIVLVNGRAEDEVLEDLARALIQMAKGAGEEGREEETDTEQEPCAS